MSRRHPGSPIPDWRHMPLRDRLFSRLIISPDGCLVWSGSRGRGGYGQIQIDGMNRRVHRMMYELFNGPIPDGLQLDHLCRNPACASPAHLEAVTGTENLARAPGSAVSRFGSRTHCDSGHELTQDNTSMHAGGRRCRQCHAARERERRQRKRVASSEA